jgi:hypothetical protein
MNEITDLKKLLAEAPAPKMIKCPLFEIDFSNIAFAYDRGANYRAFHFLGVAVRLRASHLPEQAWKDGFAQGVLLGTSVGKKIVEQITNKNNTNN